MILKYKAYKNKLLYTFQINIENKKNKPAYINEDNTCNKWFIEQFRRILEEVEE